MVKVYNKLLRSKDEGEFRIADYEIWKREINEKPEVKLPAKSGASRSLIYIYQIHAS